MSISRALGYPYDIPSSSYVLKDGRSYEWSGAVDLDGRTPVLACGSNQSPVQLARKFSCGTVPVMAGWLKGYDSVYSAHFTSYGSIAATYLRQDETCSRQMITWLNAEQLEVMHASEALGVNYDYVEMANIDFVADDGTAINSAYAYESRRGALCLEGNPIALVSIRAKGRGLRALNQMVLQQEVMALLNYDGALEDFISETIEDQAMRKARTALLEKTVKR